MRPWIALFGLLFQLLLPLVHPAVAVAGHAAVPADAVLLCTAQGIVAHAADADGDGERFACPDCDLALPPLAPPPDARAVAMAPTFAARAEVPRPAWPGDRSQPHPHPGNPRAPPPPV